VITAVDVLATAGFHRGDRLEHASVLPSDFDGLLAAGGVTVVTQPNFVGERGANYEREVSPEDLACLYRARSLMNAGVRLAAGTDAPFGRPDPWMAMRSAVDRITITGSRLGPEERLSPLAAMRLFMTSLEDPGGAVPTVAVGSSADLCLLDRPLSQALKNLDRGAVRLTIILGRVAYDRESPLQ
jgi:predicted amidohydrolase YtcJ